MEGLVMAAQLILGLSILVGVHELGHLVAAKVFGMRVEKYSIGFPPKIFGFNYGETEYSLGAIPLGGFVKISGMVDESLDTENLSGEPEPWEFRAKPAWQRLIVMLGGIIVNVIVGIIIFIILAFTYGESYISKDEVNKHGIVAYELGQEIGLRTGDKIVKVNGEDFDRFSDLRSSDVILGNNSYYTVERDGQTIEVPIPGDFLNKFSSKNAASTFIDFLMPFDIGQVAKESPAAEAGLETGDKIVEYNGKKITYYHEFDAEKKRLIADKAQGPFDLKVNRSGDLIDLKVGLNEKGQVGFISNPLLEQSHQDFTFAQAIPAGTKRAFQIVWDTIRGFGKIFRGEVSASNALSGPIEIANKLYGGTWDWVRFWTITGLLSMVLAFMNFLPIPALDGGHVVFLMYEIISGRAPSDKFLEIAQKVGMVLLLALMAFAIGNDIFKVFFR